MRRLLSSGTNSAQDHEDSSQRNVITALIFLGLLLRVHDERRWSQFPSGRAFVYAFELLLHLAYVTCAIVPKQHFHTDDSCRNRFHSGYRYLDSTALRPARRDVSFPSLCEGLQTPHNN